MILKENKTKLRRGVHIKVILDPYAWNKGGKRKIHRRIASREILINWSTLRGTKLLKKSHEIPSKAFNSAKGGEEEKRAIHILRRNNW